MKICVLAIADPLLWVEHYVKAFRAVADVITAGPPPGPDRLAQLGRAGQEARLRRNDVETPLGKDVVLAEVLPEGWEPDLIVAISSGGVPLCPDMRSFDCPRVYLSIDTWQCPLDYIDALQYHLVFVAQRSFVPAMRATGTRHARWLPLACDPEIHAPVDVGPTHDVSFAGALTPGIYDERARLLDVLARNFSVNRAEHAYGGDYRDTLCSGAVTFNHAAVKDVNMRVFEAMAMGVPLLSNRDSEANGLGELFEDGKHLALYGSEEELVLKADYYLANPEAARAMADAARAEVIEKHTYAHRVRTILDAVAEIVPGFPAARPNRKTAQSLLLQHVPWGAERFLDAGVKLGDAHDFLRGLGVRVIAGAGLAGAGNGSAWDELYPWRLPDGARFTMDAAAIAGLDNAPDEPRVAFALAAESLCPGGTLLVALDEEEFHRVCGGLDGGGLMAAFRSFDCHLTGLLGGAGSDSPGAGYLLIARKRTHTLRKIVGQALANLDAPGKHPMEQVEQLPFDQ